MSRNFEEARKAYVNALKYDKQNGNVLRDLGQLQVQLKDYVGYAETRREILVAKPNINVNWICYAVALYLKKDLEKALEVVESFEKTLINN
jgi:tetratricopeptide (TPR) repeat protein